MREREQRPRQSDGNRVRIECLGVVATFTLIMPRVEEHHRMIVMMPPTLSLSPIGLLGANLPLIAAVTRPGLMVVVVMYDTGSLPGLGWETLSLPQVSPLDNCYEPGTSGDMRDSPGLLGHTRGHHYITHYTLHCMTQTVIRPVIHQQ